MTTLLAVLLLVAVGGPASVTAAPLLKPGIPETFALDPDVGELVYRFRVPPESAVVKLRVEEATGDVDLYARPGAPMEDLYGEAVGFAETAGYRETLVLDAAGDGGLLPGVWFVHLVLIEAPSDRRGRPASVVTGRLLLDVVPLSRFGGLAVGGRLAAELGEESAWRGAWRLGVEDPNETIRVDLVLRDGAGELFVRSGRPAGSRWEAELASPMARGQGCLVFRPEELEAPDDVWLTVVAPLPVFADRVPFELFAGAGEKAPAPLRDRPLTWPKPSADRVARAVEATVEILPRSLGGGSGVILSPRGLVLTNDHVVEAPGGETPSRGDLVVALTVDQGRPAEELFEAEVVERRPDLDLALLRIVGGTWSRPLPTRDLPWVEPRVGLPRLGDLLTVVGYPETGGSGWRVTLSLSRGVVAGFQRTQNGVELKTDAEISAGSSGGPVLDREGRLVGVATAVREESYGFGRLGYVVPWEMVPPEWREMVASEQEAQRGR